MAEAVYLLCAIMSSACAMILFRSYRKSFSHILLWSALCFGVLAVSNIILVVDMVIVPDVDFGGPFWRSLLSAIAGSLLLFGLIWEIT